MRLTQQQRESVIELVRQHLGERACVFLYGSRLDDARRGGDVDLAIEAAVTPSLLEQAALKLALEGMLGLPVDLLFLRPEGQRSSFQSLAMSRAQVL